MAIFLKFKSAKNFDALPIDEGFISLGDLKRRVFQMKHLNRGTDVDLVVSNAQTSEEYTDMAALIPRNTSVLLRRVPRHRCTPSEAKLECVKVVEDYKQNITPDNSMVASQISKVNPEESEWDDFGEDPFISVLDGQSDQPFNPASVTSSNKPDEDSKLRALLESPSVDWMSQKDGLRARGYGCGIAERMCGGGGFGRGLFEHRNPPPGYVCHRCNVPGHFIQHCPTKNDRKLFKPPTGIPMSMLKTISDGSYALPNGAVAALQPDDAAFEKEIQGIPTIARAATRSTELLPEILRCPICNEIMKCAVLTKCCFNSFCDKCIRDHIEKESKCVCSSRHAMADVLVPNKTLRETITQMLESAAPSSWEKAGSLAQSCVTTEEKVPSHAVSGSRLIQAKGPTPVEDNSIEVGIGPIGGTTLVPSDASSDSKFVKDPMSPRKSPLRKDNVEKPPTGNPEQMIKKKRQRRSEEVGSVIGFMPMASPGYNPFFCGAVPHTAMDHFSARDFNKNAFLPSRPKKRPRGRMERTITGWAG